MTSLRGASILLLVGLHVASATKVRSSIFGYPKNTATCKNPFKETDGVVDLWKSQGAVCWAGGGHNRLLNFSSLQECLAPHKDNEQSLYLVGDSHSYVLGYGISKSISMPVHQFSCSGGINATKECLPIFGKRLKDTAGPGDIIAVMMSSYMWEPERIEIYNSFMDDMKSAMEAKKAHLVKVDDWAWLPGNPQTCKLTGDYSSCAISLGETINYRQGEARKAAPGAARIDLAPALCEKEDCNALVPGTKTLAYFDQSHLSKAGSEYMGYYMCQQLAKL